MDRLVIAGTFPACANFNTSQACKYGGKCIYLHQKNDDDRKNNSGVTAIKIPCQCDVSTETAKVGSTTIYDYRKLSGSSE